MKYDIYITGIKFDPILPTSLGVNSTCWPSTGVLVTLAGIFSPDGPKFNPTHLHEISLILIVSYIYCASVPIPLSYHDFQAMTPLKIQRFW